MNVVILDTGCANLNSVKSAIGRHGYEPVVSRDPEAVSYTHLDVYKRQGFIKLRAVFAQRRIAIGFDVIEDLRHRFTDAVGGGNRRAR